MNVYLVRFYRTLPSSVGHDVKSLVWHTEQPAGSPSEALVLAEQKLALDLDADCIEVKRISDRPQPAPHHVLQTA